MLLVSTNLSFLPDLESRIVDELGGIVLQGEIRDEMANTLAAHPFRAWICSPCPPYRIDRELLGPCPSLEIIVTPSTGTNHIDVAWCEANGIAVKSLRGSEVVDSITASSEFTFALMLAMLRSLPQSAKGALRGEWREVEDRYRGREMSSLTLGIIGLGRIGSNVARYAQAMGTRIMAHDPYRDSDRDWPDYVERVDDLDSILKSADVVQVSVHLDEMTTGMIDAAVFAKMKPGSFFLNTSRGEIVVEEDLVAALESGRLKAAAVDVIRGELEPDKEQSPLIRYAREHDNLLITPHIAGLTYDSERKAAEFALATVGTHLGKAYE